MKTNKSIFAQNLQYFMNTKGIDRSQLCSDTGLNYSTVSEWLKAKKYPRIDTIELLANYFEISKSNLIEEDGYKKIAPANDRRSEIIEKIKKLPDSELDRAVSILNAVYPDEVD